MKIFVFSDVHADIYPLYELDKCADFVNADLKVFLGDFITFGPHSEKVVQWFKGRNDIIQVLGNNDSYVVNGLSKYEEEEKSKSKLQHLDIVLGELSDSSIAYLKSLPKEYEINVDGKSILFTHYSWESDTEVCIEPKSPYDTTTTIEAFKDRKYDYIFYGHVHTPSTQFDGDKKLYGVGSFGVLYPARYTTLDTEKNFEVTRKKLIYDKDSFIKELGEVHDESRQYFYSIIDEELASADEAEKITLRIENE